MAILLKIFFDLSRIASLGAIFYIVMDIAIHWGAMKYFRDDIKAISTIRHLGNWIGCASADCIYFSKHSDRNTGGLDVTHRITTIFLDERFSLSTRYFTVKAPCVERLAIRQPCGLVILRSYLRQLLFAPLLG